MSENIEDIFTDEVINYYRTNKDEITYDLLDELRVTKKGKDIAQKILDIEKNEENHYLDAFGNVISFKKTPTLKSINRKIPLHSLHIEEIKRCREDIFYFMDNYVKIATHEGVTFPDLRHYQIEFIETIIPDENESIVGLLPRQCCSPNTIINVDKKDITIGQLFNESVDNSRLIKNGGKFIESYPGNGRKIKTPNGYKEIIEVHKTIKYPKFRIELENGMSLEAAHNHVVIDIFGNEIYIEDCKNRVLKTIDGNSKVKNVIDLKTEEHMYDVSIDSEDELYYSNGILSHNSGKSVSVGIYLCWMILFGKDMNLGVAAQVKPMAQEFLLKVKNIFVQLPIWLTPGVKVWNELSIGFENGMRMMADTAGANSFRGFTMTVVVTDESAYITGKENGTTRFKAYQDSILPSQSSLAFKKNIYISTANGMNDFCTLYKGAEKDGFDVVEELMNSEAAIYSDSVKNHYKLIQEDSLHKEKNILSIEKQDEQYLVKYKKRKPGNNGSIAFCSDWRKVPRYKQDGTLKTPEEFRDEVVASKGEVFFNQAYQNCVGYNSVINIDGELLKIGELWDNL